MNVKILQEFSQYFQAPEGYRVAASTSDHPKRSKDSVLVEEASFETSLAQNYLKGGWQSLQQHPYSRPITFTSSMPLHERSELLAFSRERKEPKPQQRNIPVKP